MRNNLERLLQRLLPPGYDDSNSGRVLSGFFWSCGFVLFGYLLFVPILGVALSSLYVTTFQGTYLIEGALMPVFSRLMRYSPLSVLLSVVTGLGLTLSLYRYYFAHSKSILRMRLLPRRGLVLRTVLMVPLLWILASLVWAFVLQLLCFGLYLGITPKGHLPYLTARQAAADFFQSLTGPLSALFRTM